MRENKAFLKRKKKKNDVNDDELVLSSIGMVLEVNDIGKIFYNTMRDILEIAYMCSFHLLYKNQFNKSKKQVTFKLQQVFVEQ